jgi:hypothetical protein
MSEGGDHPLEVKISECPSVAPAGFLPVTPPVPNRSHAAIFLSGTFEIQGYFLKKPQPEKRTHGQYFKGGSRIFLFLIHLSAMLKEKVAISKGIQPPKLTYFCRFS